jgi:hypothetical protein
VENGTGLEVEKTRFVPIALSSRRLDLSNRKILLMISLLLRMSVNYWFRMLMEVFSCLSQFLVVCGSAITSASNGGELTLLLTFIQLLTSRR